MKVKNLNSFQLKMQKQLINLNNIQIKMQN